MGIKKAILKEVERSLCKGLEALSTKELYTAVSNAVMGKINDVYSACLKKKEEEKEEKGKMHPEICSYSQLNWMLIGAQITSCNAFKKEKVFGKKVCSFQSRRS